jgi:hypothetical protein
LCLTAATEPGNHGDWDAIPKDLVMTDKRPLEFKALAGVSLSFFDFLSVSVRMGTTFSGQWEPPERLQRDPPVIGGRTSSRSVRLARARSAGQE